ncbi:putative odorant-binding protein A10 [Anopheles darlingi]|uniref:putative odorant-binding protein A10 n=1 Tax=Anopheles darlingi TaxID=43151 RepID=UPI002100580B|nr:putative odorant-binding protein A10 [Anopheles darlingi]
MSKMSTAQVSSSRCSTSSSWIVTIGLLCAIAMLAQLTTVVSGAADAAATIASTTTKSQVSDEALEKALSDKRYLMRQLKCALGEVPCDPVGKRLKSLAPFVLRGACPQCTPAEMTQIKKTLAHLQRNFPAEWNKLVQTYAG